MQRLLGREVFSRNTEQLAVLGLGCVGCTGQEQILICTASEANLSQDNSTRRQTKPYQSEGIFFMETWINVYSNIPWIAVPDCARRGLAIGRLPQRQSNNASKAEGSSLCSNDSSQTVKPSL